MRYEPPSPFTRWDTPLFTIPSSDQNLPYEEIWDAIFPPPSKPTSKKARAEQSTKERLAAKAGDSPAADGKDEGHANANGKGKAAEGKVDEVRRHQATIAPTATGSDALQILESTTLVIVQTLLARARELNVATGDGGIVSLSIPIKTPSGTSSGIDDNIDVEITIPEGAVLSQPMLQRLRRKYTQIQRGGLAHGQGWSGAVSGREGVVEGFVGFLEAEFEAT